MGKLLTTREFIEKATLIHGNKYDYSDSVYTKYAATIQIKCLTHGVFFQWVCSHLNGSGCPKCADTTLTISEFISRAEKIHGDKYDYSESIYNGNDNKINISCRKHGRFDQIVYNHLMGKGCPKCKSENMGNIKRIPIDEFIERCNKIHGNLYDYSKAVYTQYSNKISIICKKHGEFVQRIAHHLEGHGCPKCEHRISKGETEFLDYYGVKIRQTKVCRKLTDGIIGNVIYEYLGDFWHGNPNKYKDEDINPIMKLTYKEIRIRTFERLDRLKQMGYTIKYIWESDWKKFKKGLVFEPNILTL